ncbi:ribosomal protein S18 [Astrocystis sublimbata]|nr:ribosomal protein S18 [Astrocystis sublimbata]
MAPRIPTLSALRQGISSLSLKTSSSAPLSTTAPPRALYNLNASNSILSLDDSANSKDGSNSGDAADSLGGIFKSMRGRTRRAGPSTQDQLKSRGVTGDLIRQMPRRWRAGDVYAPHDMSPSEMSKWQRSTRRKKDLVDLLGLRPLDMYRNFSVISEFITPHGRIKRSVETGLSPVNQRKMAKAIRRAIGLGLHPSVHVHPELMMRGPNRVLEQNKASTSKTFRY